MRLKPDLVGVSDLSALCGLLERSMFSIERRLTAVEQRLDALDGATEVQEPVREETREIALVREPKAEERWEQEQR